MSNTEIVNETADIDDIELHEVYVYIADDNMSASVRLGRDKGQTITFKEKTKVPEEPKKPETPQTPDTPHKTDSPKTGDSTNLYGLLALLLTSGAGLAGIFFCKRRKMKKS